MEPDELTALGVYDCTGEDAPARLELLDYVTALGATPEELVAYRDMLPALAGRLAIRDGPVLTIDEAVERSGLSADQVRLLARAAGLPDPEPGARVLTEGFVALAEGMNAVTAVFGEDVAFQLMRCWGPRWPVWPTRWFRPSWSTWSPALDARRVPSASPVPTSRQPRCCPGSRLSSIFRVFG